jgi:hypothetical protein
MFVGQVAVAVFFATPHCESNKRDGRERAALLIWFRTAKASTRGRVDKIWYGLATFCNIHHYFQRNRAAGYDFW